MYLNTSIISFHLTKVAYLQNWVVIVLMSMSKASMIDFLVNFASKNPDIVGGSLPIRVKTSCKIFLNIFDFLPTIWGRGWPMTFIWYVWNANLYAIGPQGDRGVRIKNPCWPYLKDIFKGEPKLFTEPQLFWVQKLIAFWSSQFWYDLSLKTEQNCHFEIFFAKRMSTFNFCVLKFAPNDQTI